MTLGIPFQLKRLMNIGAPIGANDASRLTDVVGMIKDYQVVENDTLNSVAYNSGVAWEDTTSTSITTDVLSTDIIVLYSSFGFSHSASATTTVSGHRIFDGTSTVCGVERRSSASSVNGDTSGHSLFYVGNPPNSGSITYKYQHSVALGSITVYSTRRRLAVIVLRGAV